MIKRLFSIATFSAALSLCAGLSHAAVTELATAGGASTSASGTATTTAMNGTGGNFLAACVVTYANVASTATVSDSVNGTWTQWTQSIGAAPAYIALWYYPNASVSSSMTISAVRSGGYTRLAAAIFGGVAAVSPLDQTNGSTGAGSTIQPGSITPTLANELLLSCAGEHGTGVSCSISGNSFSLLTFVPGDANGAEEIAIAYAIQTTALAANPTWSSFFSAANIASFEASGGSPPKPCMISLLGAGTC